MEDERTKAAGPKNKETEKETPGEKVQPADRDEWKAAVDVESVAEGESVEEAADEGEDDTEPEGSLVPFDPLQRYLAEIRHHAILTREEEKEIAVQYKEQGDVDAAYRLVTSNLRLVVMIARKYQKATRHLLDLIQEGNIGLMEAVKNFDPYRGIRFPSYAVYWIRAYIIRYLINNWRMVKLGTTQAQRKLFFNLHKEKERLEAEGIFPGPKLIAQSLDVKESEVVEMEQRLSSRDLSIDASPNNDSGGSLLDILPSQQGTSEDKVAAAEFREQVGRKIRNFGATLKDKEAAIFTSRLLSESPLTLQEIGDQYGISRERVRQIEERLKKKLKVYLVAELKDIEEDLLDLT